MSFQREVASYFAGDNAGYCVLFGGLERCADFFTKSGTVGAAEGIGKMFVYDLRRTGATLILNGKLVEGIRAKGRLYVLFAGERVENGIRGIG